MESKKINELKQRRTAALQMGGAEKVGRQHQRGKLTVRERIDILVDFGTFQEYGLLADRLGWQPEANITPADGVVTGFGRIDGRTVGIVAEDATVLGGSTGLGANIAKRLRMVKLATQERVPLIWLFDGAGARSQDLAYAAEGLPAVDNFIAMARLSGIAPQVGVVMGACAGMPALEAGLTEFLIMVKDIGMLAAGGPPVVLTSTGQKVNKAELGGVDVHCRISGVADNPAEDEADALRMVKRYLSYLPSNAWAYPPRVSTGQAPEGSADQLLKILPANHRRSYDMKRIIDCIVDQDTFFEIKPLFAPMMITGFARMAGHTVGIVANQPMINAGAITAKAAQKERHFIDLCAAYHVPLLFLADVPGVMTGPESEKEGALRFGLSVAHALAWADVPKFTVIIRKAFGFGGSAMCGYGADQTLTLAWPTADFASIPADAAVAAAHADELAMSADPEALSQRLQADYEKFSGAYPAAAKFNIDDVIDPRETRPKIIRGLELALNRRSCPPQPVRRHGVMP
jgi:acetyl-CoA carboxylase carboxyltransferase component